MQDTINMDHIKTHYFTSHPKLNFYGIVPIGCEEWWTLPHNRDETHPIS
jgi:glutathionyl-hydroquinone reductase